MRNRLLITVDVEARPARSKTDPLDRLIWGRFPEGEFGIGRMMSIAERHAAKLTMFLDYAEEFVYGDALLDVGREIHRRGHDLQLQIHPEFMPDGFYAALGSRRIVDLRQTSAALADAYFDFLCDRQSKIGAPPPNAFRGGDYHYNGDILHAMQRHGVRLASNYNFSRDSQPMLFGPMPQFTWDTGVIESPISTVFDFQQTMRHVDYDYDADHFCGVDLDTWLARHLEFLDRFYAERGDDAVAVLVLHSWSFLERDDEGTYSRPAPDALERFDLLLSALGESVAVIDSGDLVALADTEELRLAGPFRFGPVWTALDSGGVGRDAGAVNANDASVESRASVSAKLAATPPASRLGKMETSGDRPVQNPFGGSNLPIPLPDLLVTSCPLCGDPLTTIDSPETCKGCGSRARTRTLAPILSDVVSPLLPFWFPRERPLLAFAMTGVEQKLLQPHFPAAKSVSLFGTYTADHESGVDARDLSRYPDGSFSGAFSILLFDYFPEHEQALREIYRVLAPRGVLFTHIAAYRLAEGAEPPSVPGAVKSRPGYFEYLPEGTTLPSVKVGRRWLLDTMRRTGFDADLVQVTDRASSLVLDWFVGQKPLAAAFAPPPAERVEQPAAPASPASVPAAAPAPAPKPATAPATIVSNQRTPGFTRTYATPVDPDFGFRLVTLTLSLPEVPKEAAGVEFAEHAVDSVTGAPTDTVIALKQGGVLFSHDLGRSWEYRALPETGSHRIFNSLTLADGHRLVQEVGPRHPSEDPNEPRFQPALFRFDPDWNLTHRHVLGRAHWHGTRSIDQRGSTIMYCDYINNSVLTREDFANRRAELEPLCDNSRVFRSRDGGISWEVALEVPWTEIRHFHTVAADPFASGVWWVSSGDRPEESRVWRSANDGDTWTQVSGSDADLPLQRRFASSRQSAFRYTDVVVTPDRLFWGSDDLLGVPEETDDEAPFDQRVGARLFVAEKNLPLRPRSVAYVGNSVRSIVDVGPCYLVTTEAGKHPLHPRAQIVILSKEPPYLSAEIGTIDRFATGRTGFTYSRASRIAKHGRFFSDRAGYDVFRGGPKLLQWDIDFQ